MIKNKSATGRHCDLGLRCKKSYMIGDRPTDTAGLPYIRSNLKAQ